MAGSLEEFRLVGVDDPLPVGQVEDDVNRFRVKRSADAQSRSGWSKLLATDELAARKANEHLRHLICCSLSGCIIEILLSRKFVKTPNRQLNVSRIVRVKIRFQCGFR